VLGHALVDSLQALEKVTTPVVALSSQYVDLLADTAARDLVAQVRRGDAVAILSGLMPDMARNYETLLRNLRTANAVVEALTEVTPAQLIYMSSDAVYTFAAPLAILLCTLVLSSRDTHNSYGPNRFRKQAREDGRIVLGAAVKKR
jgi:UDP-glucose 4-epimerase